MKLILKDKKAITLVALVVTIIILIILAGVSINMILGERGLITIAKRAKENMELAQEEEINEINSIEKLLNDIDEQPQIIVIDKDKWSNTNKKVTINKKEGYIVKYTTDGSFPSNNNGEIYTEEFEVDKNCTIKAIYILNENIIGKIAEEKITTIDKNAPDKLIISVTPNKTSVKVEITDVDDAEATDTDGKSGIAGYKYNCRYNNQDHWTDTITDKSYEFTDIYGDFTGVDCNINVIAIDNVENSTEIKEETKTTCNRPDLIKSGVGTYLCTINTVTITKSDSTPGISGAWYYLTGNRTDFAIMHITFASRC